MHQIFGLCLGTFLLVVSLLLRSGWGRAYWVNNPKTSGIIVVDERFCLLFLPGTALFLLGLSSLQFSQMLPGFGAYLALGLSLGLAGLGLILLLWGLFDIYYPKFFLPKWLREYYATKKSPLSRGRIFAPRKK